MQFIKGIHIYIMGNYSQGPVYIRTGYTTPSYFSILQKKAAEYIYSLIDVEYQMDNFVGA